MLEVDSSHKKIDLSSIDMRKAKKLGVKLGAVVLSIFMMSGYGKKKANEKKELERTDVVHEEVLEVSPMAEGYRVIEEHDPSELVGKCSRGVRFTFDDDRDVDLSELTYEDLSHVVECYLVLDDDDENNYDYLNYMPNVKKLTILDNESTKPRLDNVDGSRLPGGIDIIVYCSRNGKFGSDKYGFLENVPDINMLDIKRTTDIDYLFVQNLRQVHNISFGIGEYPNFLYRDMTYLDSLHLTGKTYDVVMCFPINELEASGVTVIADNLKELEEVDRQIEEIVSGLNIGANATEQEKLNAVLTYVLTEFSYEASGLPSEEVFRLVYGEGYLDGAMRNDGQICGNYAAMTSTLLKRVGVDALNLTSIVHNDSCHAWNAVKIGDYYYFVDACFLDSGDYATQYFANNDTSVIGGLEWYLVDPTELEATDYSHMIDFLPYGMEIKSIPDEIENDLKPKNTEDVYEEIIEDDLEHNNIVDISDKEFKVTINGKIMTIGARAFVGVLAALGIGKLVYNKRKREQQIRDIDYNSDYDPFKRRY